MKIMNSSISACNFYHCSLLTSTTFWKLWTYENYEHENYEHENYEHENYELIYQSLQFLPLLSRHLHYF